MPLIPEIDDFAINEYQDRTPGRGQVYGTRNTALEPNNGQRA